MSVLWGKVGIDWTQCDLDSHGKAWMQAREDFVRDNERQPIEAGDFSAIARRAEKIRKGEL